MDQISLYSMFFLGVTGTGHCIGMCGPLVFALPGRTGKILPQLAYHVGRSMTYGIIGALFGALGGGLVSPEVVVPENLFPSVVHIQVFFSLVAAGFLAWFALGRLGLMREPGWMSAASPEKIPGYRGAFKQASTSGAIPSMFVIGAMMGLLPCGLSYAAFIRALASDGFFSGAALLLAFAAGTIPGLMLVGTTAAGLFRKYRRHLDILSGMLMIAMSASLTADALGAILG